MAPMDQPATPDATPDVSLAQRGADGDGWYQTIVENLSELVCRFRLDGTILFANDSYARAVGSTRADLLQRSFWSLIPADEHPAVRGLLARLTPDQPEIRIENQFRTVQGLRWFLWTNRALAFDASGAVVEAQSVGLDLTDIRKSTEALRESEARLRALVRTSSDVAYRMSADWAQMQALDGRGLVAGNDVSLRDWLDRNIPPSEHARVGAAIADAVRHAQPLELEHRVNRSDGSVGWALSRAVPILAADGTIREWFGVAADISARKEAEERLRELADAMPQIVFVLGEDGKTEYLNAQWQAYTGHTTAEPDVLTRVVHRDDLPLLLQDWHRYQRSTEPYTREIRLRSAADGAYRWFLTRIRGVPDERGRITRWYGTSTDIHEIKLAREALQRAKEAAEAASLAKDHFLATLSHELRTPLTPALAALSMWQGHADVQPPQLRDDLALMARNLALEARLIDDLLDLTRIVRGKLALALEDVDVASLVDAVVTMYRAEAQQKGVTIVVQVAGTAAPLRADPGRLQQVFWNLLKNAVKFTDRGGTIRVDTRAVDGACEVEVSDTGAGIAPEALARLFQPFEQGSLDGHRRQGGLGLGLAISRALVEAHGGEIGAESDGPGQGARFVVRLPHHASPAPVTVRGPSPTDRPATPVTASNGHVLLVEDHADSALMLAQMLTSQGLRVTTATSVAAALSHLAAPDVSPVDLIVSDIGLPDGTGHDLLRQVRETLRLETPAIAITGFGMEEDVGRARAAGFALHLTKPVHLQQVREAVQQALGPSA